MSPDPAPSGRPRLRRPQRLALLVASAAIGIVLSGCGGASTATPPSHQPTTTTSSVPATPLPGPTVDIHGHTYPVPTENGHEIGPSGAAGTQIILTSKGFLPFHLFAGLNTTIVWTNLTSKPVRIWFEYSAIHSGSIPPGGHWTYSSKTLQSFVFRSSTGYHGQLDIGAFGN